MASAMKGIKRVWIFTRGIIGAYALSLFALGQIKGSGFLLADSKSLATICGYFFPLRSKLPSESLARFGKEIKLTLDWNSLVNSLKRYFATQLLRQTHWQK